ARSRSSGGYLLDEPPDMTPSFPRTGVSGHAGAVHTAPFQQFANRLHQWFQDPTDAKQLKTALHLYIYRTRKEESE
ncbi:hypothetical protein, partial [Mycobacterium tuberculosis]